ncbi:G2/mitotic-specific cyclin [Ceratobasidium sp. 428]|nr:G2/mitotic-specific cyclin [Ceratobasidium sp. 428]
MSSNNIPTRRTTRLARHLDENATTAGRTRGAAKPVATATVVVKTTSAPGTRRPALVANKDKEAASDVRTADAAKRKRDALGELTNKAKSKINLKGKDGKPLAAKTNESGHRRGHSATVSISESVKTEEIMDVDGSKASEGTDTKATSEEAEARPRFSRRLSARTVSASSAPPQLSTVTAQAPRRTVSAATRALKAPSHVRAVSAQMSTSSIPASSAAPTTSRAQSSHRPTPEDDSDGPVHKKRRTSSLDAEAASRAVAEVAEQPAEPAPVDPDEIWTDLDKDDDGDPLMVSEYVIDIFNYMLELEKTQAQQLNPHYIEKQKELNWGMRGILGDWLIQVHARFRLLPETLYLAMHLVDRMLSIRVVSLSRLQLVGVTCMFIASKYEEIMAPSVKHFVECADSAYTEKDILDAEQYVLRVLGWDCSYPNVMTFLRRVSKAEDFDDQTRSVAKFFVEIACVDHRLLPFPPSQIAAASLWLARLILDRDTWVSLYNLHVFPYPGLTHSRL